MEKYRTKLNVLIFILFGIYSCQQEPAQGKWIRGNTQKQLEIVEWQFRGFDKAMVETDYRYQGLYWAGKDKNWGYASYLTEKIKKAIETGLQRRPKRAASAQDFLNVSLPKMETAIESKDSILFNKAFDSMTRDCNVCHALEKMPFFSVKKPLERPSSIR